VIFSSVTTPPPDAEAPLRHPDAPSPGTPCTPRNSECFACGDHPTGLHIHPIAGEDVSALARFEVTRFHQGAPGLAHGGVIAAAFDETLGYAISLMHTPMVTGRLECDFLMPVPVGSILYIMVTCNAVAGRKIYATAEALMNAPDGPLAARAASVFITVPIEHFEVHDPSEKGWSDRGGFEVGP
jgi:acyl-coenzyme A thioesterase PaaI-like protein